MATQYDRRRLSDMDKGEFRVTIVRQDGECNTRKHTSWKRAVRSFVDAEKNPDNIFGIIRQCVGEKAGDYIKSAQHFSRDLRH